MTFYQHIGIDIMFAIALFLHVAGCFFGPMLRRVLAAVNIVLHGALVFLVLWKGCTPEEALVLMLASATVALCLGLYEERRKST